MARMMRKQVYIEPEQEARLKQASLQSGESQAQLIRRAIDQQLAASLGFRDLRAWEQERAFIAALMERGPVRGERTWRREELYDR